MEILICIIVGLCLVPAISYWWRENTKIYCVDEAKNEEETKKTHGEGKDSSWQANQRTIEI